MKVPNSFGPGSVVGLSLSRLQNEGSQLHGLVFALYGKSIKATE